MTVAEDIVDGVRCMKCFQLLISEDKSLCDCGHPVHCFKCWRTLPKCDREFGAPYFDRESGEVVTGE